MRSFNKKILFATLLLVQPIMVNAESAFDFAKIFSILTEMAAQSTIIGNNSSGQLTALKDQNKLLEDTKKSMEGHYGYGSSFNNTSLDSWLHAGKDWGGLLNGSQSGGSDPLATLARDIEREFPVVSSKSVYPAAQNTEQAKLFDLLSKATVASRASSTLAYNNVDAELLMLEKLQAEIEKSPNQKATLDLIARIQIEEAKLMAYQIKSSAVSAQLTGLQAQQELSDAKWTSEFFKWH